MLGNKRRRKSRGSESELLPSTPYAAVEKTKRKTKRKQKKKKKTTKRLRRGEDGGGRGTERGRAVKKRSRDGEEKNPGPCFVYFFF